MLGAVMRHAACVYRITACNAQCNHGDMRCFGPDPDECCSFYDPHDNSKCLNECPPETMVTDNFDCAGI